MCLQMPFHDSLNLMASRFFQNALSEYDEPTRQCGPGAGGGHWPLTPHRVQRQIEGPSGHDKVNKPTDQVSVMTKTFGMEGANEDVYSDVPAGDCVDDFVAGLVLLL